MNRAEACDLAVRVLQLFQGPAAGEWEDEFVHLDAGRVGTAIVQLRRTHKARWLSIADFYDRYNAIQPDDASTRPECRDCDGYGWVETGRFTERGCVYHGWQPCSCAEGAKRAASKTWTTAPVRTFGVPTSPRPRKDLL